MSIANYPDGPLFQDPASDKHLDSILGTNANISCDVTQFKNGNVILRVLHFSYNSVTNPHRIIFVPGWASTLFTWRYFLPRILKCGPVQYVETREKSSSVLSKHASFEIAEMAGDLVTYLKTQSNVSNCAVVGSSTGATLILEAWPLFEEKPRCVVLILPNKKIPIPRHVGALRLLPERFLPFLKPVAVHFMRNFRLTPKEVGQQESLFAAVAAADLRKLRDSGLALRNYEFDLASTRTMRQPCLIIGASNDRFHKASDVLDIHKNIPKSQYVDLGTFTTAHGRRAADTVGRWIQQNYE